MVIYLNFPQPERKYGMKIHKIIKGTTPFGMIPRLCDFVSCLNYLYLRFLAASDFFFFFTLGFS